MKNVVRLPRKLAILYERLTNTTDEEREAYAKLSLQAAVEKHSEYYALLAEVLRPIEDPE